MPTTALQSMLVIFVLVTMGCQGATSPSTRTVRFTVFAAHPLANLAVLADLNVPPRPVAFYPTARSPQYEYAGPLPIQFIETTSRQVVAEANIPIGVSRALIVFLDGQSGPNAPDRSARYQTVVMDDGPNVVSGLVVVNFSGLELEGAVGGHVVALQAGPNSLPAAGISVPITLRTKVKRRTYQSYADTIELRRSGRALLFLFPPYYAGSVEVQSRLLSEEGSGSGGNSIN